MFKEEEQHRHHFRRQFDLFPLDDDEDESIPLVKSIDIKVSVKSKDEKCLECGNCDLQTHFTYVIAFSCVHSFFIFYLFQPLFYVSSMPIWYILLKIL